MEDPEPISTPQETNENNNVDFKNVLNGSVLSSLSKTLDLALLENSTSDNPEDIPASSVSCDPAIFSAPAATVGSSDVIRDVPSTTLAIVAEERSRGPHNLLLLEENVPGSPVSSSSYRDEGQTSLIPCVNSLPEVVCASETGEASNNTSSLNGTAHKCRDVTYRPASPTTDDRGSEKLLPDTADGEPLSASASVLTGSFEKLQQNCADQEQTSTATSSSTCSPQKLLPNTSDTEPTSATSNSSACSTEKTLTGITDTERTSAATTSTCSSQKSPASITDKEQTSKATCFTNGLNAEFSPPVAQQPSMSCLASSSNSNSTSSIFPRSSSLLSGTNSFGFSAEALDCDSSGDSTDYEDAFDWDISGNIEYYDFKDREKVKLSRIVPREQDTGACEMDFAAETSFMKASSPLKRKRTIDDDETFDRHFANPSRLGTGKSFKSSVVGKHFHQSSSSTSSSQPSLLTHPSTVNGTSNSFDDLILSSSTSSNKPSTSKPPPVSLSKAPSSTYMFKAPSLSTRASKPPLPVGAATSRLANRTPSFKLRIGINPKSTPSISSGSTAPLKSPIVINSKSSSISRGSITSLPPIGSGKTAPWHPICSGRKASVPPTGRGSTASFSSTGNGSTALCPDLASAQPNRTKLREALLDVMRRHRRARVLEEERVKKFTACRKELLGDILKQLNLLQAQCKEGLM